MIRQDTSSENTSESSLLQEIYQRQNLKTEINDFIAAHAGENPSELALKLLSNKNAPEAEKSMIRFMILQLEARRKFAKKLAGFENWIFPTMLSGEQSTNSQVGNFHASLIKEEKSLLDMTAGLGIDFKIMTSRISATGEHCRAVEMDPLKAHLLRINLNSEGLMDTYVECGESISVVEASLRDGIHYDLIFVDPARRSEDGKKLYDPYDCSPDVITNWGELLKLGNRILVKNSPMLDLSKSIELFPGVEKIYVVTSGTECKEVLIDAVPGGILKEISAVSVNRDSEFEIVRFSPEEFKKPWQDEFLTQELLSEEMAKGVVWIYEPNPALMKIAAWQEIAKRYGLKKFSVNGHLFLGNKYIKDFPGRITELKGVLSRGELKKLKGKKRNVIVRNYPLKANELAKKLKIESGGDKFIYGVTCGLEEKPILIETEQIPG